MADMLMCLCGAKLSPVWFVLCLGLGQQLKGCVHRKPWFLPRVSSCSAVQEHPRSLNGRLFSRRLGHVSVFAK